MTRTTPVLQLTWESARYEYEQIPTDDIVRQFAQAASVSKHCKRVRRTSDTIVVKRTSFDGRLEYDNQMLAWRNLNNDLLRVPEPIRYFEHSTTDGILHEYIVMEYLRGISLEEADDANLDVITVAEAILHIHKQSRSLAFDRPPGPPGGGVAEAFPWGRNGAEMAFKSIQDLEDCANKRLRSYAKNKNLSQAEWELSLGQAELGLCHLDLAARNILILENGKIGIVDWNTLAFYPAVFEFASLWSLQYTGWRDRLPFFERLMSNLERKTSISEKDGLSEPDSIKVEIVHDQSLRYSFD